MQKYQNIEKITLKVVQMKFLAMHITNKKFSFDTFPVGSLQNIFMEYLLMIFGIKEKSKIFITYNVFLAVAINTPFLLMTGFVVQGHISHIVQY